MSRTFYIAVGGLLVLLGMLLGLTMVLNGQGLSRGGLIGMAVPIVPGLGLILLGLSNPYAPRHRSVIKRKAAPLNLLVGLGLILGSSALLYLYNQIHFLPPGILGVGALLGIPVGVFIMASIHEDACARCNLRLESVQLGVPKAQMQPILELLVSDDTSAALRLLELARADAEDARRKRAAERLRAGDTDAALRLIDGPAPGEEVPLEVAFCPSCRAVAVCKVSAVPKAVLQGTHATLLISTLPPVKTSQVA